MGISPCRALSGYRLDHAERALANISEQPPAVHDLPVLEAEVIQQWVKAKYGVRVLLMVVPHTFGRHATGSDFETEVAG
jgi:hypothetical protein